MILDNKNALVSSLESRRIFLMHVPKTGGISLALFFRGLFEAESICPPPRRGGVWNYTPEEVRQYRMFAGHFDVDFIESVDPQGITLTILRDPVSRTISLYDFWRSISPEWADEFLGDAPINAPRFARSHSFSAFLRTDNTLVQHAISNAATRQLLGKRYDVLASKPVKAAQAAFTRLHKFDWFGTTENLTVGLSQLAQRLGVSPPDKPHVNRTYSPEAGEPRGEVIRTIPSTTDLQYCAALNQIDLRLYRLSIASVSPRRNLLHLMAKRLMGNLRFVCGPVIGNEIPVQGD